jgi:hypothetical protein
MLIGHAVLMIGNQLVIDFMNLKIKPAQSFRGGHRGMMCMYIFIEMSDHICINIYICIVLKKYEASITLRLIVSYRRVYLVAPSVRWNPRACRRRVDGIRGHSYLCPGLGSS